MPLIDDIKERLSIVDVVSDYVALDKLHTRAPEAPCPFHEERTPSFKLNTERDTWRCFGACNEGGDIFNFVMRIDDVNFPEALGKLAAKAGIELKPNDTRDPNSSKASETQSAAVHKVNAIAADYWDKQLWGEAGLAAREYLAARGIDKPTAQRWGLGYAPAASNSLLHYLKSIQPPAEAVKAAGLLVKTERSGWRDMFVDRITFALRDKQGNIVGFAGRAMGDSQAKYINTSETEHFHKSSVAYGLDKAADAIAATGRAIVVEGYMDVIAAHENGFKNVVGCMGTAVTSEQVAAISNTLSSAQTTDREIVLCLDNDEAGKRATLGSLGNAMLGLGGTGSTGATQHPDAVQVRVATPVMSETGMPKDPDEAIRSDPHAWLQSIQDAREGYQFVVDYHIADGKRDEVLAAVEPLMGQLPPSTISGKQRVDWLAQSLGLEASTLEGMLVGVRARRGPLNDRNRPRSQSHPEDPRRQLPDNSRVTRPYRLSEYELVACLVQEESALDHVIAIGPAHFESNELGELFEIRQRCSNLSEVSSMLAMHNALSSLYTELLEHQIELPDSANVDRKSAIMHIVSACVSQVQEAHLRRQTRNLSREFRDPDLPKYGGKRQELLHAVSQTYEELKQAIAI